MVFGMKDYLALQLKGFYEKPKKSRKKKIINKKEIDNLAAAFILEGALQYISNYTDD